MPSGSSSPSPVPVVLVPLLLAPVEDASLSNDCTGDTWAFDWSDVSHASRYHVVVIPGDHTEPALELDSLTTSSFTWARPGPLDEGSQQGWRWRVRAHVDGEWRDWTPERNFRVDPLLPELRSPTVQAVLDNGCSDRTNGIEWEFAWSACASADAYHLHVIGATAQNPVIDIDRLREPTFVFAAPRSYIVEGNRRGWTWRVRARLRGEWRDWTTRRVFDVEPLDTDCAALAIPLQVSPRSGSVFDHFPRTTTLAWQPVPGADSYSLDIDVCQSPACVDGSTFPWNPPYRGVRATSATFDFVGAQPGRWRVWAEGSSGRISGRSPWWEFRYTQ